MSDMLEQAIIDADALKEAATKNAETLVLEKYSNEIKKAVETLLEQDELEVGMEEDLGVLPEEGAAPGTGATGMESDDISATEQSSVMEHIPFAATSTDDEKIEIPLDKLLEEVDKLSQAMRFNGDEVLDEELYLNEGLSDETTEEDILEEDILEQDMLEQDMLEEDMLEEQQWDLAGGVSQHGKSEMLSQYGGGALGESLEVDLAGATLSGWASLTGGQLQLAEEELLALEQDSKVREENEARRKAVRELNAVNETITKQNKKLTKAVDTSSKYMIKLKEAVLILKRKLDKVNLDNAKLLYQNKALTSTSLNERQKQKLAEAVANAETIDEAKVIFETLQNTVGSTSRKTQPNSLSEAVQKSSSVILSSRKQNSSKQNTNPTLDRWKFLAGIDKQ